MSEVHPQTKVFRAEKTTKNVDDLKVMIVGSVTAILMLLIMPLISQVWDSKFAPRPFVTATLEIIQTDNYHRPMILYDADAKQSSSATWIATVHDASGARLSTRRGDGDYYVKEDNPRLWTWEAFFEDREGSFPPLVPNRPFKICIRFVSIARDSGVIDETPVSCSPLFYPEANSWEGYYSVEPIDNRGSYR